MKSYYNYTRVLCTPGQILHRLDMRSHTRLYIHCSLGRVCICVCGTRWVEQLIFHSCIIIYFPPWAEQLIFHSCIYFVFVQIALCPITPHTTRRGLLAHKPITGQTRQSPTHTRTRTPWERRERLLNAFSRSEGTGYLLADNLRLVWWIILACVVIAVQKRSLGHALESHVVRKNTLYE